MTPIHLKHNFIQRPSYGYSYVSIQEMSILCFLNNSTSCFVNNDVLGADWERAVLPKGGEPVK